jgi:hypothetical protein
MPRLIVSILILSALMLSCATQPKSESMTFEELKQKKAAGVEVTEAGKCLKEAEEAQKRWTAWRQTIQAEHDFCMNETRTIAEPSPPNSSRREACLNFLMQFPDLYSSTTMKAHCDNVRINYTRELEAYDTAIAEYRETTLGAEKRCYELLNQNEPLELRNRITFLDCTALFPGPN